MIGLYSKLTTLNLNDYRSTRTNPVGTKSVAQDLYVPSHRDNLFSKPLKAASVKETTPAPTVHKGTSWLKSIGMKTCMLVLAGAMVAGLAGCTPQTQSNPTDPGFDRAPITRTVDQREFQTDCGKLKGLLAQAPPSDPVLLESYKLDVDLAKVGCQTEISQKQAEATERSAKAQERQAQIEKNREMRQLGKDLRTIWDATH